MNGQWIGPYSGTNEGLLVVDLDDAGDHYEGSASALDYNAELPPTYADLIRAPIPKGNNEFDLRVLLKPIDRMSGQPTNWEEIKHNYPSDVEVANYADTHWKVTGDKIEVSWQTDLGTHGKGVVEKSKGYLDSALVPIAEIKTWEDFRKFTRELEPYRYIFRGQTNNRWRLRTSFHRTGRASLVRFMVRDIPVLHRHLSGMMAHHLDLRDPFQTPPSTILCSTTGTRRRSSIGLTLHSSGLISLTRACGPRTRKRKIACAFLCSTSCGGFRSSKR